MATWTTILAATTAIDKPIRSIDITALVNNITAAFEKAGGAPQLAANYIVASMIAANEVTTVKILDANVTLAKLSTDAKAFFTKSDGGNLAIGTFALGRDNAGAGAGPGVTTANFAIIRWSGGGWIENVVAGTWRNVSGVGQASAAGNYNQFQRIA